MLAPVPHLHCAADACIQGIEEDASNRCQPQAAPQHPHSVQTATYGGVPRVLAGEEEVTRATGERQRRGREKKTKVGPEMKFRDASTRITEKGSVANEGNSVFLFLVLEM